MRGAGAFPPGPLAGSLPAQRRRAIESDSLGFAVRRIKIPIIIAQEVVTEDPRIYFGGSLSPAGAGAGNSLLIQRILSMDSRERD
jgi:hypothetical protein